MSDLFGDNSQGTDELAQRLAGRGTRSGLHGRTLTFEIDRVIAHPSTRALHLVLRHHDGSHWLPDEMAEYLKGSDGVWRVHMPTHKARELGLA